MNTDKILKDFDFLVQNGVIGCYNSCEVTEIFAYQNSEVYNIYTLICLEYSSKPLDNEPEYLSGRSNKWKINKNNWKAGIRRVRISIANGREILKKLSEEGKLSIVPNEESKMGNIEMQGKAYVPSETEQALNNILKNNFYSGSYIIEAFDCSKKNVHIFLEHPECLNKISEQISQVIRPLDIASASDRLGNVIFQFPINLIFPKVRGCKGNGLDLSICYHPYYTGNKIRMLCTAFSLEDGVLYDYAQCVLREGKESYHIDISTDRPIDLCIYNDTKEILLEKTHVSLVQYFQTNINIPNPQKRIFSLDDNENKKTVQVNVASIENRRLERKNNLRSPTEWENVRIYERQLQKLEDKGQFRQFFKDNRQEALENIRKLITNFSNCGVYLWDPYASAVDIKNTLYYVPYDNVPVRVITALHNMENNNKDQQKEYIRQELLKDDPNYALIDLEVRALCYGNGENFHDRFLIFPTERPRVWSLGTSINNLGKTHHIVVEVQNAQHILDAFEQMWDQLNCEECLVWKS